MTVSLGHGLSGPEIPKKKLDATTAPTADNDISEEYSPGSLWVDISNDKAYICLDNAEGAAVWTEVTVASGGLADIVDDTTPQLGGQLDVNGNAIGNGTLELITFVETASAVNEIEITNAATGNAPQLGVSGDDDNIDLALATKGTGALLLIPDSADSVQVIVGETGTDYSGAGTPKVRIVGDSSPLSLEDSSSGIGPTVWFRKSAGTGASPSTSSDDDDIGRIAFAAYDGTDYASTVARIIAKVDGTIGSNDTPGKLIFQTTESGTASAVDRMIIDNAGNVLIGADDNFFPLDFQVAIVSAGTRALEIDYAADSGNGPRVFITKTRGSVGSLAIVQDDDDLGQFVFTGHDGNDTGSQAAIIGVEVDGTPAQDDMPGRIVFMTTPSGSNSAVERMRLSQDGRFQLLYEFSGDTVTHTIENTSTDDNSGALLILSVPAAAGGASDPKLAWNTNANNFYFGMDHSDSDKLKLGSGFTVGSSTFVTIDTDGVFQVDVQAHAPEATLTDAASISWNLNGAQTAKVTLAGNRTLSNPTNMKAGATYILRVIQDGTGTRTLSFDTAYLFPGGTAPTMSTGSGDVDILTFYCDGTNMYGVANLDFS